MSETGLPEKPPQRRVLSFWPDLLLFIVGTMLGGYASFGTYWAGYFGGVLNMGSMLTMLTGMGVAWVIGLVLIARTIQGGFRPLILATARAFMAVSVFVLTASAFGQPGGEAYLAGFSDSVWSRTDPAAVQTWAEDLVAHRAHSAGMRSETSKAMPDLEVLPEDIPDVVRRLWARPPDIVIIQHPENETPYVRLQWYSHGILAGPPDIAPSIKPFRLWQVRPGVYVYIFER